MMDDVLVGLLICPRENWEDNQSIVEQHTMRQASARWSEKGVETSDEVADGG